MCCFSMQMGRPMPGALVKEGVIRWRDLVTYGHTPRDIWWKLLPTVCGSICGGGAPPH